jgi:predicted exporter
VFALPLALAADFGLFRYVYRRSNRLTAYVTLIHVVVSIILGVIVFGLLALIQSAPG